MSNYRGTIKHPAQVSCKSQIHTSHAGFGGGNRTGNPRSQHPPRLAVGRTPDFLSSLLALARLVRLSSLTGAHAGVGGARAGNPDTWDENDGRSPTIAFAQSIIEPVSDGLSIRMDRGILNFRATKCG